MLGLLDVMLLANLVSDIYDKNYKDVNEGMSPEQLHRSIRHLDQVLKYFTNKACLEKLYNYGWLRYVTITVFAM